ncbi:MAG: UDP-N-acetylmuramoyl-tripeptide--D-alanyl-D-alanine ligase [Desulfobacterales bacterium]|nr:MAG: UDP-N-acetylmuramoyl-tripeptide--D-alanyl-D-alanine ligase [Desulfobacterales bacterium]
MTNSHPIPWTTSEILEATGGELLCGDRQYLFAQVFIDSRRVAAGGVFVAVVGEVHDGHTFAPDVVEQGGRGLVISNKNVEHLPVAKWKEKGVAVVAVEDTTRALGDMAAFNRRRSNVSVVAITGSNGKTTTRQMTAAVVSQQFNTLATVGNLNNQIGLPLTLLGLEPEHQWAVVELGTNYPGEIARLAEICTPDVGVITNIGPAHLEGLGSMEGVAREKGSLLKGLGRHGKAVLNADDPRVRQLARQTAHEVHLYGLAPDAAIRADDVAEKENAICFTLKLVEESISIRLNSPGRFMVTNALAAAAVGNLLGLSAGKIKAGLEAFEPVSGRMNIHRTPNGIHIIDDTYNANPDSMKAALTTLKRMRAGARGIFVAGDMLELGRQAASLHSQVGALAARSGINRLYAYGEYADSLAAGARNEGLPAADSITGSREEIIEDLIAWLQPGDWVLVKGSRGMAMEKVVQGLKDWAGEKKS